ncbi:MAG: hypothetical protein ACI8TQ_001575 [Planctomycetota bacterium]|jgi:hypothetical protein
MYGKGTRQRVEKRESADLRRLGQLGKLMDSRTTNTNIAGHDVDLQDRMDALALRTEEEATPQAALGLTSARTFNFFGLLLAGSGLALTAAPYLSWTLVQAATWLGTHGVATGTLTVGGLVLLGCGTIGNAIARLAERPQRSDTSMVDAIELMADQVTMLTGSLTNLYDHVTVLGTRDSIVHVDAPPPSDDLVQIYREQKEAVFQLAAGLDKLGHQVSERLSKQDETLSEQFDALRTNLTDAHEQLSVKVEREIREHVTASQQMVANVETTELDQREVELEEFTSLSTCDVANFAEADQDLERDLTSTTMIEFARINELMTDNNQATDETTSEEVEIEEPHPELEAEVSPLAFLEGLKAIAPASQDPHSPSVSTPALDFDLMDKLPAALPANEVQAAQKQNEQTPGQF